MWAESPQCGDPFPPHTSRGARAPQKVAHALLSVFTEAEDDDGVPRAWHGGRGRRVQLLARAQHFCPLPLHPCQKVLCALLGFCGFGTRRCGGREWRLVLSLSALRRHDAELAAVLEVQASPRRLEIGLALEQPK